MTDSATDRSEAAGRGPGGAPRRLGPYRVIRFLGGGGMGVVFEAEDTRLGRHVALKLLPREWSRDPAAKRRFRREARAASALDHPNICTVHDIGEAGPQLYLVMAMYPGKTLDKRLERGPLPVAEARELAIQVARGLARAHGAGIVHRDIKPGNIMVTDGGEDGPEVKVLDFGIAKIAGDVTLTSTGKSMGTPYYMSPEQASGEVVDGRTDIWSLGVVLYEMLTGLRPFEGRNQPTVIHAIVYRHPEPVRHWRQEVPEDLERVVAKALAKDPARRYRDAAELLADLEAGTAAAAPPVSRPRRWLRPAAAVLLAVLLGLGGWWARRDGPAPTPQGPATAPIGLAVLYFQNLRDAPEIDWLRQGITEMLVTELKQSPALDVLSTRRLYSTLADLGALEDPLLTPETVRALAERHQKGLILQGSYFRQGEQCRITFTLDDPTTGEALLADQVIHPDSPECFLNLVDDLSFHVRRRLEVDRDRGEASSLRAFATSPLAWRRYVEGLVLYYESKEEEAITRLEEAVDLDPQFALAWRALGSIHRSLGHSELASDYLGRAFELADRLPPRDRFSVRARYYADRWTTLDQAIEIYEEGLALYPNILPWQHNLGYSYATLERYEEALLKYEEAIAAGSTWSGAYFNAALIGTALGRFDQGYEQLANLAEQRPDDWKLQDALGWHLASWGRFPEAEERFERAAALLGRDNQRLLFNRWQLEALRGDWTRAGEAAARFRHLDDSYARSLGAVAEARGLLFGGRSAEALNRFDEALRSSAGDDKQAALVHTWRAELLLQRGEPGLALEAAAEAQRLAADDWPELRGLFLAALAQQDLGRPELADGLGETLRGRWQSRPNGVEERQLHHLRGLLALARGDAANALTELGRAAELLPTRGIELNSVFPQHVAIWFALGEAALAAGDPEAARSWLERVSTARSERLVHPVPWVRSAFLLGRLYRQQGDPEAARRSFTRFVESWRDGDLDRLRVEEAIEELGNGP